MIDTGATDSECKGNQRVYEFLFCIAHFIGDGTGTHHTGQSFFALIGTQSDEQLAAWLKAEWTNRWGGDHYPNEVLPRFAESAIPRPENEMQAKAWRIDFEQDQANLIGGHTIPRLPPSSTPHTRHSRAHDLILSPQITSHILIRCKSHGVTVQQALFALCNVGWIRTKHLLDGKKEEEGLPMMFYTALNYGSYIPPPPPNASPVFLAVGYFNVLLPSSFPSSSQDLQNTFWQRARSVRAQSKEHLTSKMLPSRTLIMSEERGKRAKRFAAEDDGFLLLPRPPFPTPSSPSPSPAKPPSLALLGLSQLGPLDRVYTPSSYPALNLTNIRSTTRKAKGGILLFTFTFRGKLHLSLGWDRHAFENGVVERFLDEVEKAVGEFFLSDGDEMEVVRAKL
jgi:hypothetical protein